MKKLVIFILYPLFILPVILVAQQSETDIDNQTQDTIKSIADMNLQELGNLKVSPFEVSTRSESGYRASNSVSGSRFDAPILDLPFAIQAFTESFINDQKPVNIFDITRYSPGITYRSNDFNEGNANLAIRGFAVSASPGNIQILRDGFHGPSIFDFTNISRVEVVKGPASFLYGQVAPGGIVNIITKRPQQQFFARADARYGSYNQYRFDVDVTGPAAKTLFYRLAASYDHDMEYWEPYDAYSRCIAPSLLWQPSKRLSFSLKYESFYKMESPQLMQKPGLNRQTGVVPTVSDPNLRGVDFPLPNNWNGLSNADFRKSKTNGLSAWIDFRADDHWDLRASYSHQAYEIDALFSGNFGMANNTTSLQGRRFRGQTYTNKGHTYQAEAVGKYKLGRISLHLLFGGQYIDRSFDSWAAQAPNDPVLGSDPTASPLPLWDLNNPSTWNRNVPIPHSALTEYAYDNSMNFNDKSLYIGATFGFFEDRLLFLSGLRRTATKSQFTDIIANASQDQIIANATTPQLGVLYKFSHGLSAFGSYAESFVPGSQILNLPDGTIKPASPTKGSGYDIGIKAVLLNGCISGTFTVFDVRNRNIVNDLAHTDSTGSVVIYNMQSGEQCSRGIELDVTASMTNDWQLYISYSYMDARIIEFSGNDDAILAEDWTTLDAAGQANYKNVNLLHNAPLQMSAPHMANLWTRYNFSRYSLMGFFIAGGANFVYDQTVLPDGSESTHQTYTLFNVMVGHTWTWKKIQINLDFMGKNLADAYYRPSQSTRCRPREILLTLTAKFY